MASDLIKAFVMKPPYKRKKTGFRELPSWGARGDAGRVAWPGEGLETPFLSHAPGSVHLPQLAVSELFPLIINQ